MKKITICGKEYPIEYTVEAEMRFAELGEGKTKVGKVLTEHTAEALHAMMTAAYHRGEIQARILGEEYKDQKPLEANEIRALLLPKEMPGVIREMAAVMTEAYKSDVEAVNVKKTENVTQSE